MNDESFNSPFCGLKKDLKGREKTASFPPAVKKKQAPAPSLLSQDFTGEDDAASVMFMVAMGRDTPAVKGEADDGTQSMAELLAEHQAAKKDASQMKAKKKPSATLPPHPEDIPNVELDGDEAQSFAKAMQDVRPVNETRGRALVPPAPPAPIRHKSAERDYLTEFTEGKYEFALEYTEEFFEGHVMGMDPLVIAKLRAGQYSPETHIDLHGLNAEQAYSALLIFTKDAYIQGRRNLVVVTGRGKNSPGGLGILRQNMQEWLTKEPLRRVVLAFCTAQPKDGGAGALYVLLRKFKKSTGKIRWEKGPWEEKPLI